MKPTSERLVPILRLAQPLPLPGRSAREAATAWLPEVARALGIPKEESRPGPVGYAPEAGRHLHPDVEKGWFGLWAVAWRVREQGLEHHHPQDLVLYVRERDGAWFGVGARRGDRAAPPAAAVGSAAKALEAFQQEPERHLATALGTGMTDWLGADWKVEALTPVLADTVPLRGADDAAALKAGPWGLLPDAEARGPAVAIRADLWSPTRGYLRVVVRVDDHAVLDLAYGGAGVGSIRVWDWDPVTAGSGLDRGSPPASLDALCTAHSVATTASNTLQTARVKLCGAPAPTGPDVWNYPLDTQEGARLQAFWHADAALAQIEDLGFPLTGAGGYLQGQLTGGAWPLPVEVVLTGSTNTPWGVLYAYASRVTVRIPAPPTPWPAIPSSVANDAVDRRMIWHEIFGHVVLYNHVKDHRVPASGIFTHSAGDSFAAMFGDVEDPVRGHGDTFPYTYTETAMGAWTDSNSLPRRHDRAVAAGWGWGDGTVGSGSSSAYGQEQKLSTTLFRVYRSLGGDSASQARRRLAARTTAWLTLEGIGMLTAGAPPTKAEDFAETLQLADLADWTTQGWTGGAYNKVIRWAFEKQGAYQSPLSVAAPTTTVGTPPPVDVYFPDSLGGEYDYHAHWPYSPAIWNRLAPDGLLTHQQPVAGTTNHLYVRLRNRGPTPAPTGSVSAWVSPASVGGSWPTQWTQVGTRAHPPIAANNGGEVVVGPFPWTPATGIFNAFLGVVDNPDDPANTAHFGPLRPVGVSRLVPYDNNVALRITWYFKLQKPLPLPPLQLINDGPGPVRAVLTPVVLVNGRPRSLSRLGLTTRTITLASGTKVDVAPPLAPAVPMPFPGLPALSKSVVLGWDVSYDGVEMGGARWVGLR